MPQQAITEAQEDLLFSVEGVYLKFNRNFDKSEYDGFAAAGFAHITAIDGRCSFVQRSKTLADNPKITEFRRTASRSGRVSGVEIEAGCLRMTLKPAYDSGYRLSVSNIGELMEGPEFQRLDVREDIHSLVLEAFQNDGYLPDARVRSRMD